MSHHGEFSTHYCCRDVRLQLSSRANIEGMCQCHSTCIDRADYQQLLFIHVVEVICLPEFFRCLASKRQSVPQVATVAYGLETLCLFEFGQH